MARYLTRRGAEVDEAADGVEGLARLRTQPANVILADLRMPRMGGVELYAQLEEERPELAARVLLDRKSTRLNSSHTVISYAVFCLKKKKKKKKNTHLITAQQ